MPDNRRHNTVSRSTTPSSPSTGHVAVSLRSRIDRSNTLVICILLVALLIFNGALFAQEGKVAVRGTVFDPNGHSIPGAILVIAGQVVGTTDSEGRFQLEQPLHSEEIIIVSHPDFAPKRITIDKSRLSSAELQITLQMAPVRETITVSESVDSLAPDSEETATRMNIPVMDLPQSVSAITGTVLKEQGAVSPRDAFRNVAGVRSVATVYGTQEPLTLRGFSQFVESTYLRDGARFTAFSTPNVIAADRVEVLKGPASILYGSVVPGGVINIVSKKPLEEYHHELTYRGGSFGSSEGFLDSTGPIWKPQSLYYRVNLYGRKADTFKEHGNDDSYLLNPSLSWRPTPKTNIIADMEYDRLFTLADPGIPALDGKTFDSVRNLPHDLFLGAQDGDFRSLRRFYSLRVTREITKDWVLRGAYDYNTFMRAANFLINTALSPDGSSVVQVASSHNYFAGNYYGRVETTGSVRVGKILNTVLAGGDTLLIRTNNSQAILVPAGTVSLTDPDFDRVVPTSYSPVRMNTKTKQLGGYVQDMLTLPNGINILAGFRFTNINDYGNKTDQSKATPMLGLLCRPRTWLSLYGTYAESFVPVTGTNFAGAPFRPSLGKQFEFGMKNRLFSNKLATSIAWFNLTRTNVTSVDPLHPFFSIQSGEQRSCGIEVEVRGNITSRIQTIANYAYTDARVTKDAVSPVGTFLPQAPRHTAAVWATYQPSGVLSRMILGGGVYYTASWWDSILNSFQIPGNTTADAYASWRFERHYRLQFNVKNILDRQYYSAASNLLGIFAGQPRSFQISAVASF